MELAGIVQEFNPYARALSEANQNGKITLEGAIKGEDTSIRKNLLFSRKFFLAFSLVFSSSLLGFQVLRFFLHFRVIPCRSRFQSSILLKVSDSRVCNLSA